MANIFGNLAQLIKENPYETMQFGAGLLGGQNFGQGLQQGILSAMQTKQWSDQRDEKKKREEAYKQLLSRFPQAAGAVQDMGGGVTSQDLPAPLNPNQPNQYGFTQRDALLADALGPQYLTAKLTQGGGQGYTLGEGQVRFGADNTPVAYGPPKRTQADKPKEFALYNSELQKNARGRYGPDGNVQVFTENGWEKAGPNWGLGVSYQSNELPSSLTKNWDDYLSNARNALMFSSDIINGLKQNGSVTGILGSGVRGLEGARDQLNQLAEITHDDLNGIRDEANYDFGKFTDAAVKSGQLRSNLITLAYMKAKLDDPGARLTDKDVQNAMKTLTGGNENSRIMMISVLSQFQKNIKAMVQSRQLLRPDVYTVPDGYFNIQPADPNDPLGLRGQ